MYLFGVLISGMVWVVRRILTNQREIDLLRTSMEKTHEAMMKESEQLRRAIERETDARIQEAVESRRVNQELIKYLTSIKDK